jgi:hypothetical protein
MNVLGIHVAKNYLRYALLNGTKKSPKIIEKDRLPTTDPSNVPALMDWYESNLVRLLDSLKPDKIAYRLTLDLKKEQLFTSIFPLGILNLLAHKKGIPIKEYTPRSFVPSKLNMHRRADIYEECDNYFGKLPPYWDNSQKNAVLAAWFELK